MKRSDFESARRSHPYAGLSAPHFWKASVANRAAGEIALGWKPKFAISRETRVLTAGSCFAQHISRALRREGFRWVDAEPAPEGMPDQERAEGGYGVFSFRTGNIYSAALLKQWIFWATGRATPGDEVFEEDGRFYDPFRPNIPAAGYESREALQAARRATLDAIARAVREADLFVFTLGLTEAWKSITGEVYPMCPGTLRGSFSPSSHYFHDFEHDEIVRDLAETFDELRRINPEIRFLLTVSPVPLAATATDDHVLVATMRSKSVLRAVAGLLARKRPDVDYFPSYELIAAPPFRGQFFEPDMRSVTRDGVEFVMKQFLSALEDTKAPEARTPAVEATRTAAPASDSPAVFPRSAAEEVCEEVVLQTWSPPTRSQGGAAPPLFLVGDSQMGMLSKAMHGLGIDHAGGAIMDSRDWHSIEFVNVDDGFFRPFEAEPRQRWEEMLALMPRDRRPRSEFPLATIVTNIGDHSYHMIEGLKEFLVRTYGRIPGEVSTVDMKNYFALARSVHLNLVHRFVSAGFKVIFVTDPPTQKENLRFWTLIDSMLSNSFQAVGCAVFNARDWIAERGGFPDEYRSTWTNVAGDGDPLHGSDKYYADLAREILVRADVRTAERSANDTPAAAA